ncbi:hypothetical protein MZ16F91_11000 [Escherichia coli]
MALTDAKIRAAKPDEKPYKLADSGNMFLLVHPNGSRYWRLRYRFLGKEKTLALGVYPEVSLSEAREKRDAARKQIAEGTDPCEQKRIKKSVPETAQTFEGIARQWHKSNKKWSASHSEKILKSLETHVFPFIGSRDITTLRTPDLLVPVKAAEAKEIYEIAARLQQRITAIMRYAAQSGIITYNPAVDMAGALTTVKRQHRPALALNRISELLERLDTYRGQPLTRLATKLTLLIFIRSSEFALPGGLRSTLRKPCGPFLLSENLLKGSSIPIAAQKCVQSIWFHSQLRHWIFSNKSRSSAVSTS